MVLETKYLEIQEHESIINKVQQQDKDELAQRLNELNQEHADRILDFERSIKQESQMEK